MGQISCKEKETHELQHQLKEFKNQNTAYSKEIQRKQYVKNNEMTGFVKNSFDETTKCASALDKTRSYTNNT